MATVGTGVGVVLSADMEQGDDPTGSYDEHMQSKLGRFDSVPGGSLLTFA